MNRVHVLVAAILVMVPVAGGSQGSSSVPFVAVFEMQNEGAPLRPDAVSRMGNYLFSNLAACGSFRLVPQDQVRSRLAQQKTESYRDCYDQTCQIELSREMAADKALSSSVTKVGSVCQVSASLYDLTTAAIERAAVAEGPCTEDGIRGAILTVVARLCGAGPGRGTTVLPGAPAAPPPTWNHQGTTPVAPNLPAVADERGVLRVEGTPRNARVDVTGPRGFGTNGTLATALPYGPATVPAGEYRVQVSAPDHDTDTRTVKVYADRTALVGVALALSNGVLELWGRPAGAKVELTCQKGFSRTFGLPESATAIPVPRGSCRVQVTRNGYEPFERQVDVAGGKTARVDVNLFQIPDKPPASAPPVQRAGSAVARTWRDPATGLTWQNPGADKEMKWKSAKSYCATLPLAGGGWRLPTISELRSLIRGCAATQTGGSCGVTDSCLTWHDCRDDSCGGCTSEQGPAGGCYWPGELSGACGWYWSSSPVADVDGYEFIVGFARGRVNGARTDGYFVRCVR